MWGGAGAADAVDAEQSNPAAATANAPRYRADGFIARRIIWSGRTRFRASSAGVRVSWRRHADPRAEHRDGAAEAFVPVRPRRLAPAARPAVTGGVVGADADPLLGR